MKNNLLLLLPGTIVALAAAPAAGQNYAGLALSNYAGTNAAYTNPSAIADSRHRYYLQLVGAEASFYSTYLQLNLRQRPWQAEFSMERRDLAEQGGSGPHAGSFSGEARLPSLLLTLGPHSAVAFSSRGRGFVQASNVSDNLARLAYHGLDEAQQLGLANHLLEDNSFNLSVNTYHEFALTYARVVGRSSRHFWKAGLTAKYLVGLGSAYVLNDGTTYQVYGRDSLQLQTRQLSYGATDYRLYGQRGFTVSSLYGGQQLGGGYGADLGLTYEYRPDYATYNYHLDGRDQVDRTRNKYRLRLGLALTDLGALTYDNAQHVRQGQLANAKTVQLGHLDTLNFRTLAQGENTLERLTGLSSRGHAFTSYLPAALRLTADYHVAGPLYAGALWVQNLLPARTIGSRSVSTLALVPRLELRRLELALPVQLLGNYRQVAAGAMLRLGPLVLGSDNLGGLLGLRTATGADFYFGLSLAGQHRRPKDRDHDGVSNKHDQRHRQKGTWENKGCPEPAPLPAVSAAAPVPAVPDSLSAVPAAAAPAPAAPASLPPSPALPAATPTLPDSAPAAPVPAAPALTPIIPAPAPATPNPGPQAPAPRSSGRW